MKEQLLEYHRHFYLFGLAVLIAAIPTSNYLMSVSQMLLGVAWLLAGNFVPRIRLLRNNLVFWAVFSIFIMHLIGLIYTTDFAYAWKDIRTKLPLFILPFVLFTMPDLTQKELKLLIWIHALTLLVAAIVGIIIANQNGYINYRLNSPWISHIRFSLNICVSIVLLWFEAKQSRGAYRWIALAMIITFIAYLTFFGSGTGFTIIVILLLAAGFQYLWKHTPRWVSLFMVAFLLVAVGWATKTVVHRLTEISSRKPLKDFSHLPLKTKRGNEYLHDTIYFGLENGNWVGLFYCEKELAEEWKKRSSYDFEGKDDCGQPLKATLVRYLNSRHLLKDADGMQQLTNEEIRLIEKGVAKAGTQKMNAIQRALEDLYLGYEKYIHGGGTKGNSVLQRYELLKASLLLIKKNPWLGVGTGDIPTAFKAQLKLMNSDLQDTNLRSHNQFLSIAIGYGITGLFLFLSTLILPLVRFRFDHRFFAFIAIVIISMLNEDTIETQAGVTFFSFFLCFFAILVQKRTLSPNVTYNS